MTRQHTHVLRRRAEGKCGYEGCDLVPPLNEKTGKRKYFCAECALRRKKYRATRERHAS